MRRFSLLFLLGCLPGIAHASAVVIWPVDPVIRAGEQASALWLENKGGEPITLQVRTLGWSQPDGEDRLDRQDAIVASPPIATVAPGARQLVRIIRRVRGTAPEASYRLVIDELPKPPDVGAAGAMQARLAVQMRYSVPLFALTGPVGAPQLDTRIVTHGAAHVLLIRNAGAAHARLTDLRLLDRGREIVVKAGLAGYVLPGATLALPLPAGQVGTVKVRVNGVDQALGNQA